MITGYFGYKFFKNHSLKENRLDLLKQVIFVLGTCFFLGGSLVGFTQAERITEDSGTHVLRIQPTDISLTPVFEKDGEMVMQVTNKGDRAINVTKFTVSYGPPNMDPVSYSALESKAPEWTVSSDVNHCFTSNMSESSDMNNSILRTGERATCDTGIKFPGKYEVVKINVEAKNFEYSETYSCAVNSEDTRSC